jgi:hypothetical protein
LARCRRFSPIGSKRWIVVARRRDQLVPAIACRCGGAVPADGVLSAQCRVDGRCYAENPPFGTGAGRCAPAAS